MSLFGALNSSLTSLTAQSSAVNAISNNISNLSTTGFKSTSVSFSTLVTGKIGGGVLESFRQDIDSQGAIQSTNVTTDLAIQGNGFFAVRDVADSVFYTRAGSFRTNSVGELVNEAGYVLQGWPLDASNRLPGESGNENTTSFSDLESLTDISTAAITGTASPTTNVSAKINLNAEEDVLEGAGDEVAFTGSTVNEGITSKQTIGQGTGVSAGDTVTVTLGEGFSATFEYDGFSRSSDISAGVGIGGTNNVNSDFNFTEGDTLTVKLGAEADPYTFTFKVIPNTNAGEFSTLSELATAINLTDGLASRVTDNRIYVSGINPDDSIDFGGALNTDFGFADVASVTGSNRFATLEHLNTRVSQISAIGSSLVNATGNAQLRIFNNDPTDTITFTDSLAGDELLAELGLTSVTVDEVYNPTEVASPRNMASGVVAPDFSRTVTIFNSLGQSVDLRLGFAKIEDTDSNQVWAVELYAANPDDVESDRTDGLITSGRVTFNGDGTLKSVSGGIAGDISINPSGGASTQVLNLSLGTPGNEGEGLADGLSQFAGAYTVDNLSQNGFPTGRLQSLDIDTQGFVTAIFDNSLTSKVYKLPIAYFQNPNGLRAESGNAFSTSNTAGEVTLAQIGDANVGSIVPGALEVSTSEIGEELTRLIVSQQAYSASANVLQKVTDLFRELQDL